jgi:peptide/nickel transport system permease protein
VTVAPDVTIAAESAPRTRPRPLVVLALAWRTTGGKIGLVIVLAVSVVALVGPLVTPYSTTETVALPFQGPSGAHPFGTDFLGRDALSRFLDGGLSIVLLASFATVLAYAIGVPLGMFAGFRRSWPDLLTLGVVDILLAFPALVLILLLLALAGPELWVVVVGIATAHIPRIVRILRSVTIDTASQEYVEAALLRGETTWAILRRELLPNLWSPVIADAGIRLTGSFLIAASLGFLGIGLSPPEANWGVMVSENRLGLNTAPLTLIPPAIAIALFAVGVNLFADAMARALGRSVVARGV